jgi:hypothetical protein
MGHRRLISIAAIGATILLVTAQEKDDSARALANAGLKAIAESTTSAAGKERLTMLGFPSIEQARNATLDQPIAEYYIPITKIKDFTPSSDANTAIVDARRSIYPVIAQGVVYSGITISVANGRAHVAGLGRAGVVTLLEKARTEDARLSGRPIDSYFAVEIPDLFTLFLGYRDKQGALWFTFLLKDSRLPGIEPSQSARADAVLLQLRPYAERAISEQHNSMGKPKR